MTRLHGIDRATAKKISGHLTDSMFSRYDIIDEADIKAAKRKVDTQRMAPRSSIVETPGLPLPSELLRKLSSIGPEKLAALIALLQA